MMRISIDWMQQGTRILTFARDRISGVSPGVHTTTQSFGVPVSHLYVFFCLTGSSGFAVSGTVKDDFLVTRHGRNPGLKFPESDGSLQIHRLAHFLVRVGAY
jgi:hypothetical protein